MLNALYNDYYISENPIRFNGNEYLLRKLISPYNLDGLVSSGVDYNIYSGDYIKSIFEKNGLNIDLNSLKNYDPLTDTYTLYYENSITISNYAPIGKAEIELANDTYYVKQELIWEKLIKTVYIRLDRDFKILGYECGYEKGDIFSDDGEADGVTDADAEYLLMHTFFNEEYPVNQHCDFNNDGSVTDADAEHLLMFTFFPDEYPIN